MSRALYPDMPRHNLDAVMEHHGIVIEHRHRAMPDAQALLAFWRKVRAAWPQDRPLSVRVSSVDGVEGGVEITDSVAFAREAKARGADLIDCSSGGLLGSATAARIPRGYGFQVPFAETIRREAEIATMAVGLILHPQQADDVVAQGQADLVGIGREALFDPNWPLHARLALGEQDGEVFGAWPKQYGWWLERREPGLRKLDGPELPYRKGQAR